MSKSAKKTVLGIIVFAILSLIGSLFFNASSGEEESIKEVMRDAVLHENDKVSLLGMINVNPAVISGFVITATILIIAIVIRLFIIPRFKYVPGPFQVVLEEWVGYFTNLAKGSSPHKFHFLSAYIFGAGSFVFLSTLFELLGIQAINVAGHSISLPAPLSDINAAIALGSMSYIVILIGGIAGNGIKGIGRTLKEISLLVSMSFRLFGALLSGLLVTELVYYYITLSFVLPVFVGVMFTLLHALIQTYVLTMLVALYYGEVSEKSPPKPKKNNKKATVSEV